MQINYNNDYPRQLFRLTGKANTNNHTVHKNPYVKLAKKAKKEEKRKKENRPGVFIGHANLGLELIDALNMDTTLFEDRLKEKFPEIRNEEYEIRMGA